MAEVAPKKTKTAKKTKRVVETPKAEEPAPKVAKVVEEEKKVEEPAPTPVEKKEEKPVVEEKKEEAPKEEAPKEEAKEEAPKEGEEAPKEEEKPKDVESDAIEDSRKRITEKVHFVASDSTINALINTDEIILASLTAGGMGNLLAGVRGNTGVKSGRYYYEARITDAGGQLNHHQGPQGHKYEFRIGFSTAADSHLLGGAEGNFIFNIAAGSYSGGKEPVIKHAKRARQQDQIGVLLNRDPASPQKETISLFVNGLRITEPQALPEGTKALFPHVIYRGCNIVVNFGPSIYKPLEFTTRMLGDASKEDVEASTVKPVDHAEVIFPIGFDCADYITEFAEKHPEYVVLTSETMKDWAQRSKAGGSKVACCDDGGKSIASMQRHRKYICKYSDTTTANERQQLCQRFAYCKKVAHVMMGETTKHVPAFDKVTLPEESEGFDHIEWIKPKEECEKALEAWKADCKLRSKVDNLKVGTLFKEKIAEFRKLVEEKKKDKAACVEWSDEDYMLVALRAEVHYLIHAFKTDVDDEARLSFSTMHFGHYYRLYNSKPFDQGAFNLAKVDGIIDYISDVLTIDEKTLMFSKLDKDVEQEKFFELTEQSRCDRQDRLDAGDENSALKFSARTKPQHHNSSNAGKPNYTGQMRQIPQKRPAGQNWRQPAFKRV